jgi:ribosomal protein S18 acetylase RimI-like enzyme
VDVTIRSARADDIEGVLALWLEGDAVPSISDDADGLAQLLKRDSEALILAVDGDRVVGSVVAGFDGWRGAMYRLVVAPDRRRQGIARALVAEGERRLEASGARRIQAMVMTSHPHAIELWQACGYEYDGRMSRWIKTPRGIV